MSIGVVILLAVFGVADSHYYRMLKPDAPSYSGTTKRLTTMVSLADAHFNTGRLEAPESTIGGQTTCIICFVNPKSHAAVPCGHQSACGDCSAKMTECPICRKTALMWMHVRVA